ncbi:MAG: divalent-cation tolerance protein CutA [Saprospiraceae bacterium]|nr:divalent-cation tolerance protein CutA [Candidatus Vicinibacter affinis]MBP6172656.1 divalent-cation tolerance protein CutA [Saprospiraceae bacterium]MBK7304828.1 divalent-cation tolerance protein CutA [Candidatus Vicinibacter affinis]MBK7694592.1 divalent-cation tolerance protein CutA [Candidatus Vicinibacter affinis]MBK7799760.1 divalent-cation tolerance protein CutA [Candidatus Vicinibacter affinis]
MKKIKHRLIYFHVPCPDKISADKLGDLSVQNRLAACAHIFPITSIFEWQGKVNKENEHLLILKTTKKKSDLLESFIAKKHHYDIPCILKIKGSCNASYYEWVKQQVKKPPIKITKKRSNHPS